MDMALLIVRLVLAAVFAVAGLAKLADRRGSRQAMVDFGLPAVLAAPLGMLLPLAELAVAVALLPLSTAWWGAVCAAALLLFFVAAIAVNLARGRKPDCHCFGQIHSAPAGWTTLVRNGLLAALAGFIIWQGQINPGSSALGWLGTLRAAEIVGLIAGVIVLGLLSGMGWLLLHVIRQNGRLLMRLEALEACVTPAGVVDPPAPAELPAAPARGLPVGTPAPAFALPGLYGEMLTLDSLRAAGQPIMLTFSDPGCGPCNTLAPEVARWQRQHAASLTIALISHGTLKSNRAKNNEQGLSHVLLQSDHEVAESYQVVGTPSAVIVRPDGTIGSPLAEGVDAIRALVTRTVGAPAAVPSAAADGNNDNGVPVAPVLPGIAQVGDAAPLIRLPDLAGNTVELQAFRGTRTVVLFWNPGCGFCRRMLDDLKAWEASPPEGAPKLLVVSTGTVEANQAESIQSTVVLDQGFATATRFGASGTPSAVLVDEEGRVASDVAVGAPAVLALTRGQPDLIRPAAS